MALYDAFVSYSHAKDKPIAAALQSVIQQLGKPWYRRRALRIFRDDTSLSATPSLWPAIEHALAQSRFLIVLASPEAAASPWVNKEVAWWLNHHSVETILIAVTDGELAWDNAVADFIWREAMPLPPVLTGRFAIEPKWVDLRAYRDGADPSEARFTEHAADFAAAIHGLPKEDLLSQEVRQQRRALRLAWSAALLLLCLAGLAGWQAKVALDNERLAIEQRNIAEQQRQLAQEQRGRAERTLAAATETANTLVFDMAREFQDRAGMPRDLVRRILDRAQALQRQLAESGETAPELRRSEAAALGDLVNTLLALGDTKAALDAAQRARMIMEKLITADPGNRQWQRDQSIHLDRLGDVLTTMGRREDALAEYRRSLAIREKLAAADPGNTQRLRDLSISHNRIGDALRIAGQWEGALAEYRRGLDIIEKLAADDTGNAEWQHGLSVSHERIGDVLRAAGRHEDALKAYRWGFMITEKLATTDPGNTEWRHGLSVSHDRIGDVLLAVGRREEALTEYRRSLEITQKLAAADPANTRWQHDLSISHDRIGDVHLAAGRRNQALSEYHRSFAIRDKLATADPDNTRWQANVVISLYKISTVSEPAQARNSLQRALAIVDMLAQRDALTAAQKRWPQSLRAALAKLPPETADAQ
jgi:tetratricopeptide (TPR) repeat protein